MDLKFVVNDYVLIWNLLFQASISSDIQKLKQKLWVNYHDEYNATYKDIGNILKDTKNFIPKDDTIYNIFLENKEYENIKKATEKYRMKLLEVWDKYKKATLEELKDILRFEIDSYTIFVVSDMLDIKMANSKYKVITIGKKIDTTNPLKTLIDIIYEVVKEEVKISDIDCKTMVKAVVELATYNELQTRMTSKSYYMTGDPNLSNLKRAIYPYWLMYLGIPKDKLLSYMMRDKVAFEIDKVPYENALKKVNLIEFIKFCIKNEKYIVKENDLEVL